jgi:hypothetical protein
MSHSFIKACSLFLFFLFTIRPAFAQENKVKLNVMEGIVAVGYVDEGAYLNFAGPNISLKSGSSRWMLGMLPSLRFKQDNSSTTVNSVVVPALGVGITYVYKRIVLQVPCYYNSKTSSKNGKWFLGGGLGWKFQR